MQFPTVEHQIEDIKVRLLQFNQQWNVYIEGPVATPNRNEYTVYPTSDGKGEYRVRTHENGVVQFGYWDYDPKERPGHGGEWSSRESMVGPIIGKQLVEVAINRVKASMTVEDIQKYLPAGFGIVTRDMRSGERVFEVQDISN